MTGYFDISVVTHTTRSITRGGSRSNLAFQERRATIKPSENDEARSN